MHDELVIVCRNDQATKSLDSFDFKAIPTLNKMQVDAAKVVDEQDRLKKRNLGSFGANPKRLVHSTILGLSFMNSTINL